MEPTLGYQIVVLQQKKTSIAYYIPPDNWSQYYDRRSKWDKEWTEQYESNPSGDIGARVGWNVYDLPQVREHLTELREKNPDTDYAIQQVIHVILDL